MADEAIVGTDRQTHGTVLLALAANLLIAVAKVVGGAVTGSPVLLAKAAHSVADSVNEVFLLAAVTRSRRVADARHPFGYGKERFFWSMLAAVGIFVTGGCFSFYQGLRTLLDGGGHTTDPAVALGVLGVALAAEGTSLLRAVHQIRGEARAGGRSFLRQLRDGPDPTVRTVFAEDSTAVVGLLVAGAGISAHELTGSAAWEGAAPSTSCPTRPRSTWCWTCSLCGSGRRRRCSTPGSTWRTGWTATPWKPSPGG